VERLKSPRVRLFVALDLPGDVLEQLVSWQRESLEPRNELRLLPKESLHLTLVFLGYQAERDVERIAAVTFEEPAEPFELRPAEVVPVPPRRPRLYAIGMEEGAQALTPWQGKLSERLEQAGLYKPEKRPFWPHLTVARLKRDRRKQPGAISNAEPPSLPDALTEPFQARALTLYKSTLRPQGALYEPLASVDL
jgi:RNA 2',3'-cyclic 3'-phosphodiesterase